MLYLYGLTLRDRKLKERAWSIFLESVKKFPYNWSAWQELSLVAGNPPLAAFERDTPNQHRPLLTPKLKNVDHWMAKVFSVHLGLEWQLNEVTISMCNIIQKSFPSNSYLAFQRALANYNLRGMFLTIGIHSL